MLEKTVKKKRNQEDQNATEFFSRKNVVNILSALKNA